MLKLIAGYLPVESAGGDSRAPRDALRSDIAELASLGHPSLSVAQEFGLDDATGRTYLVRPYIEGSDVLTATRTVSVKRQLWWMIAAAEALGLLHRAGFVHGNVKPTNLLVPRGAVSPRQLRGPRVVLCDPAWWEEAAQERESHRDRSESDSAPQRTCVAGRGSASDLHALGRILYTMLTGRDPDPSESGFPEPPAEAHPGSSIHLSRVVMKLLHPDPARRYHDADELVEDLSRIASVRGQSSARPATGSPTAGPVPECFLGRDEELTRIVRLLCERDLPVASAVTGEAGMGKSSFLKRLALELQLRGRRTILVHCHSETSARATPLESLAEGLIPAGASGRSLRSRLRELMNATPDPDRAAGADARSRGMLTRSWLELLCAPPRAPRRMARTVLLVDDVHLADSLTIEVLGELAVHSAAASRAMTGAAGGRSTPDLVVSFRDESPFRSALAPLARPLETSGAENPIVELRALDDETVTRWLDFAGRGQLSFDESIPRAPSVQGHPFAIRETLQIGRASEPGRGGPGEDPKLQAPGTDEPGEAQKLHDLHSLHSRFLASKDSGQRALLETLAVLGRPASPELLRLVLDIAEEELELLLDSLTREGTLREDGEVYSFRHGSFRLWMTGVIKEARKRTLHGRIASHLEQSPGSAVEEIAHHWLRSGEPPRGVPAAVQAARQLSARHEHRPALDLYRAIPECLGPADGDLRRTVLEETAESYSRLGQHPHGVEILRELLRTARDQGERGRLHGRLGVYSHRAGDVSAATTHLEKALACLEGAGGVESFRQRLAIESELAEIASNRGDYGAAARICQRALGSLDASPHRVDGEVRRAEMVLLETLAHLRLRRFEYDAARQLFEQSLRISRSIDATSDRSLILNNLGILHNQQNRFPQAIDCYRTAARLSRKLGDDIVLVNIESNLALLHAKCGDLDEAEAAIARAVEHEGRCDSARTRFMRLHAAGLVDLLSGRYASGVETLHAAISLGEELKDRFLTAFDLVYLGECHLYRGEAKAAEAAFARALSPGARVPVPVASMVGVRRAVAASLRGEVRDARALLRAYEESATGDMEYIDAWNLLFAGWAARQIGDAARAAGWLGAARKTFRRIRVGVGELHADLELASLDLDRGKVSRAAKRLEALGRRSTPGRGPLRNPMLAARLLTALTRLELEKTSPNLQDASSLLVEAESHLIGRRMRDLEDSVRVLRRRLQQLTLESTRTARLSLPPLRSSVLGDDLPRGDQVRGLRGAALDLYRAVEDELGKERSRDVERSLRELERHIEELRRADESRRKEAVHGAESILGGSSAIGQVVRLVRQLAPSSMPILITGETGTGKELVARALHGESGAAGPFVSVSCAALPEELLEAELFGYERGAFSGADTARPGLLRSAAGGTVLFDEIGETTLTLQGKLLRVLDRRRVRSIGSAEERELTARFLFTTNRDLRALLEAGEFRRDLYYRLSGLEIAVPPLRERLDDLPLFIELARRSSGREDAPRFSDDALRALAQHPWPGNVRELQNVVTRLVLSESDPIGREDVQAALGKPAATALFSPAFLRSRPLAQLVTQLEREYLVQLHDDSGGDMKAMARALGISPQALYKRFKTLGVRPRDLK